VSRLEDNWEARFQASDTPWERGDVNPAFTAWRDAGAFQGLMTVLLPAGGRAPEAKAFAELAITPTVVDIAPAAVAHQHKILHAQGLSGEAICADLLDWAPAAPFDAIYEQTAMCALPPETWECYAANLQRWLRPEGLLFALFVQREGEGGPPYHQDLNRMRALFPAERWMWPDEAEAFEVAHPAGICEHAYILTRR